MSWLMCFTPWMLTLRRIYCLSSELLKYGAFVGITKLSSTIVVSTIGIGAADGIPGIGLSILPLCGGGVPAPLLLRGCAIATTDENVIANMQSILINIIIFAFVVSKKITIHHIVALARRKLPTPYRTPPRGTLATSSAGSTSRHTRLAKAGNCSNDTLRWCG